MQHVEQFAIFSNGLKMQNVNGKRIENIHTRTSFDC